MTNCSFSVLRSPSPRPSPLWRGRIRLRALGFSNGISTNPVLGLRRRLETILLLLGEKAGMRAVVLQTNLNRLSISRS